MLVYHHLGLESAVDHQVENIRDQGPDVSAADVQGDVTDILRGQRDGAAPVPRPHTRADAVGCSVSQDGSQPGRGAGGIDGQGGDRPVTGSSRIQRREGTEALQATGSAVAAAVQRSLPQSPRLPANRRRFQQDSALGDKD